VTSSRSAKKNSCTREQPSGGSGLSELSGSWVDSAGDWADSFDPAVLRQKTVSEPNRLLEQIQANTAPGAFYRNDDQAVCTPVDSKVRLIAYYLPQFHPIPENDLWWGKGFTEWTNVTKAVPRFFGHYQPRLPGELGFYDLRSPDIFRRQTSLAKKYGIYGFCLHYYWFGGRTLLETPLNLLLENKDIDFKFCLCWANENWTRRWDGQEHEILIAQSHSPNDDIMFARSLERMFRDPRYIRINGRPLLVVYHAGLLPDPLATARRWRHHFASAGLGNPYLVMAQTWGNEDPRVFGFDAAVEFPPHKVAVNAPRVNAGVEMLDPDYQGNVNEYDYLVKRATTGAPTKYKLFPCVCPSWDNEARRPGKGSVFAFSTPAKYGDWLTHACRRAMSELKPEEQFVFINAWNEWAEGAYLEPDRHFGFAYLNETAGVLSRLEAPRPLAEGDLRLVVVVHDAQFNGAQMLALRLVELFVTQFGAPVWVLLGAGGPLEEAFRKLAPTERVENGFADLAAWRLLAERLVGEGFTAALCNSLASARSIDPLRDAGLRCTVLVNELPSLLKQFNLREAADTAARHADVAVFPSAYVREKFHGFGGPIVGSEVIRPQGLYKSPAPANEMSRLRETTRNELGIPAEAPVVLGVASGDLRKGVDLWPAVARRVLAIHPTAFFVWVGPMEPSLHFWLSHDMEAIGHKDRLVVTGAVQDVAPFYAMADVFLLTSREDPFPSVVLEAMANGLPAVAFDNSGGVTELVRETGGLLAPYLDTDAMANAICNFIEDAGLRDMVGQTSRQIIAEKFDFGGYGFDLLQCADPTLLKVSVIVPNYNYAEYLKERLQSIWSQTYPVFEIIVLDDASTDGSVEEIAELQKQYGRKVRLVRNDKNSGSPSRQWALGVKMARGELVWIAEADDFADREFLAEVTKSFRDRDIVLSYCQSRMVDKNSAVLADDYLQYVSDVDQALWRNDYNRPGRVEIEEALSVKNTIPNVSAAVFRRNALIEVLDAHLDEMTTLRNAADWLCYLRMMTKGSVNFVARSLNNHRRHQRSTTLSASASDRRHLEEIIRMQRLAASLARVSPERKAAARRWSESVAEQFHIVQHEEIFVTVSHGEDRAGQPSEERLANR
jgi:glycosyltransferase involved in cell wall biosynthesis